MTANAGIHIRPSSFRVSSGETRKGTFVDYRRTLLSGPLAGLTAVGDANMLKNIHTLWKIGMPPSAPIIGRITAVEDRLKANWGRGDAELEALRWANDLNASLLGHEYDDLTRYIYWQHKDETTGDAEWQVKFELAALKEMLRLGRRYAGFNFFTHTPYTLEWDGVDGWAPFLPVAKAIADAGDEALIALHVYVDSDEPLDFAHQKYGPLRPQPFIDRLRRLGYKARFAFTESGTRKPWAQSGLSSYDALNNMMRWMYDQYQKYPEVICINLYDCSTIDDGEEKFYVPPEAVKMIAAYNQEHRASAPPAPNPAPVPTPLPTPVPTPVPNEVAEYVVVAPGGMNVRKTPGKLYAPIGFLPEGFGPFKARPVSDHWVMTKTEFGESYLALDNGVIPLLAKIK